MSASHRSLSRRERQIMDILYEKGRATAFEVLESLPDPPSYSAVRAALSTLEAKKHIRHEKKGTQYIFVPNVSRTKARRLAVQHLLRTFFGGSLEQAVAALMDSSSSQTSEEELARLAKLIEQARRGGKK